LLTGHSVREAFANAQGRVRAEADLPPSEHEKFLLLTNAAATIFSTPSQGDTFLSPAPAARHRV
jgi:hypothetical protein